MNNFSEDKYIRQERNTITGEGYITLLHGLPKNIGRQAKVNHSLVHDFATASYLGYDTAPEIVNIVCNSLGEHGLGRCASPLYIAPSYYKEIEEHIKTITGYPDVILFSSTSLANMAAVRYGCSFDSIFLLDEFCHRSLTETIKGNAKVKFYNSCDAKSLHEISSRVSQKETMVIITDGVFSMSGQVAPIDAIYKMICDRKSFLIIDDAHGFGVLGDRGQGVLEGLPRKAEEQVIYIGSLTKSTGAFGAFIACSSIVGKKIRQSSPQYGFSCCIPLAYAAAAAKCCELIGKKQWQISINRLKSYWFALNEGLNKVNRSLLADFSPIAVMEARNINEMYNLCKALYEAKIIFNPVGFPAIRRGLYRLRFCLSASHQSEQIQLLVKTISDVIRNE